MRTVTILICAMLAATLLVACGPTYVRGSEVEGLDDQAMSTGLDKRDIEKLFDQNIASLMESGVVEKWKAAAEPPVVSIFPIANETSEHIRDTLDALLSKVETKLINSGVATVVDSVRQNELIAEVKRQQGGAFDETKSADVGRQLGAKYFVTGKVYDSAERVDGERRVQYIMFMKVVEIETGVVRWQFEANVTKALLK